MFLFTSISTCTFILIHVLKVQSKDQFGVLHISHIYDYTKKAVIVEILSAEHIPGLSRSGKLINPV